MDQPSEFFPLARMTNDNILFVADPRDRWPAPRGDPTPTVIGRHDWKDKDHWLASPKRQAVFGPLGVTNIRTFVDPENPTQVAELMDVADVDVLMAAMQSEPMAEAMAYDGVLGSPGCDGAVPGEEPGCRSVLR